MQEQLLRSPAQIRCVKQKLPEGEVQDRYAREPPDDDELLQITALELASYFNFVAYGAEQPQPHDKPLKRSSTITYMKKAISYFMPRKSQHWDSIRCDGNPTKSDEVNDLIKRIKKQEVRKVGVPPQARRPFEASEFISLLRINFESLSGASGKAYEMWYLCHALWTL